MTTRRLRGHDHRARTIIDIALLMTALGFASSVQADAMKCSSLSSCRGSAEVIARVRERCGMGQTVPACARTILKQARKDRRISKACRATVARALHFPANRKVACKKNGKCSLRRAAKCSGEVLPQSDCALACQGGEGNTASEIDTSRDLATNAPHEGPAGDEFQEQIPDPDGVIARCTIRPVSKSEIRTLNEVTALNTTGTEIWPGGLLQGSGFESGVFAPITIPRAPCTITISNVHLPAGANYSATVDECTFAKVQQATQDLVSVGAEGTVAEASFDLVEVKDFHHFMFKIGLDARFWVGSVHSRFQLDRERRKHNILMTFRQKFFDVTFQDPERSTSVFRDGDHFVDADNQIDVDNPPLYVSQVTYGRIVYLVAESDYSSKDLEAALKASFGGLGLKFTIRTGVTVEDVFSRTELHYYVLGGDAGAALTPIEHATTPAAMATAVRSLLSDPHLARFAPDNPGAPISYALNYLKNRQPARMSFTVNYEAQDCDFIDKRKVQLSNNILPFRPNRMQGDSQLGYPLVNVRVRLRVSPNHDAIEGAVYMKATEWYNGAPSGDRSVFEGESDWYFLYGAEDGRRLRDQMFREFDFTYWDLDRDRDDFDWPTPYYFIKKLSVWGSTKDGDYLDTRVSAIEFGEINVAYE